MNRAAARATLFRGDDDRRIFLRWLAEALPAFQVEAHAYCLMTNHYHLLVRSMEGRLSEAMRILSSRFTFEINTRYGLDGAIFRGRYRSIAISSDAYLVQTLRYIHLNPVEAKLAPNPEAWPWSSASCYVSAIAGAPWLKTATLLELFGQSQTVSTYRAFLTAGIDDSTRERCWNAGFEK